MSVYPTAQGERLTAHYEDGTQTIRMYRPVTRRQIMSLQDATRLMHAYRQEKPARIIINGDAADYAPFLALLSVNKNVMRRVTRVFHWNPFPYNESTKNPVTAKSILMSPLKKAFRVFRSMLDQNPFIDNVVVASHMAHTIASHGVPRNTIRLQYAPGQFEPRDQPINILNANNTDTPLRVLTVSRLDKNKGLEHLIYLAQRCKSLSLPIIFSLAGGATDGAYESELKHKGDGAITFLGEQIGPQLVDSYKSSDVFYMPSHAEAGIPLVAQEALLSSRPIVGRAIASMLELFSMFDLSRKPGFLIKVDDDTATEEAVVRLDSLANDRKLLNHLSQNTVPARMLFDPRRLRKEFVETTMNQKN